MEKEFIPYEQALELKELGFDEDCLGTYYEEDKSFYMNGVSYSNSYFIKAQELIPEHPQITASLYQQAFRWFREKYNLDSLIQPTYTTKYQFRMFHVEIKTKVQIYGNYMGKEFKSYQEAELECLKKLIEIVKTK